MDVTQADNRDLAESMHAFEAAVRARRQELTPPVVRRILLCLDGSNQDDTALGLAGCLAGRYQVPLLLLLAYPGEADAERDRYLESRAEALRGQGIEASTARRETDVSRQPGYEQILRMVESEQCDLVVVPAPYMEDFAELGAASVGTNLDLLMARSRVPLLVVREPRESPAACFNRVLLPITLSPAERVDASSWAVHLVSEDGQMLVLAVVDPEMLDAAGPQLQGEADITELDEDLLAGLQQPAVAGLIGALQRMAVTRDFGCRVAVRVGDMTQTVVEHANTTEQVVVVGCPCAPTASGYQRVQALMRASRNPVLMVPGEA